MCHTRLVPIPYPPTRKMVLTHQVKFLRLIVHIGLHGHKKSIYNQATFKHFYNTHGHKTIWWSVILLLYGELVPVKNLTISCRNKFKTIGLVLRPSLSERCTQFSYSPLLYYVLYRVACIWPWVWPLGCIHCCFELHNTSPSCCCSKGEPVHVTLSRMFRLLASM